MEIRRLTKLNLTELLALYSHLHEVDEPLPDDSALASVWEEIEGNRRHSYFGAFLEETMVSSCNLTVIPNLTRGCRPYGVIENVVTLKEYRNRGIGKAILCHSLNQAWLAGCYKVMLMTGRKDQATLNFYESAGFDSNEKQAFIAKPGL